MALREHRHAKLGYPDLQDAAKMAERFDFTSDAEPPWQILKELNNDRTYFEKARLIAQRAIPGPVREAYLEAKRANQARLEAEERKAAEEKALLASLPKLSADEVDLDF